MKLIFNSSNSLQLQRVKVVAIAERKALISASITPDEMIKVKTEKCILLKCTVTIEGHDSFSGCVLIKNFTILEDSNVQVELKLMSDTVNIPYDLLGR